MKCSKCKNDPVRIERCEVARVDSWTNKPCVAPTQLPLGAVLNKPRHLIYCATTWVSEEFIINRVARYGYGIYGENVYG
jgi:hypothetical protein